MPQPPAKDIMIISKTGVTGDVPLQMRTAGYRRWGRRIRRDRLTAVLFSGEDGGLSLNAGGN